nr:unnamed protein product [Digitaria exilis]
MAKRRTPMYKRMTMSFVLNKAKKSFTRNTSSRALKSSVSTTSMAPYHERERLMGGGDCIEECKRRKQSAIIQGGDETAT